MTIFNKIEHWAEDEVHGLERYATNLYNYIESSRPVQHVEHVAGTVYNLGESVYNTSKAIEKTSERLPELGNTTINTIENIEKYIPVVLAAGVLIYFLK